MNVLQEKKTLSMWRHVPAEAPPRAGDITGLCRRPTGAPSASHILQRRGTLTEVVRAAARTLRYKPRRVQVRRHLLLVFHADVSCLFVKKKMGVRPKKKKKKRSSNFSQGEKTARRLTGRFGSDFEDLYTLQTIDWFLKESHKLHAGDTNVSSPETTERVCVLRRREFKATWKQPERTSTPSCCVGLRLTPVAMAFNGGRAAWSTGVHWEKKRFLYSYRRVCSSS